MMLRPERLFLALVAMVVMVSFVTLWHLPQPIRHPGFDSSSSSSAFRRTKQLQQEQQFKQKTKKKKGVCDNYAGVLHIQSGDAGAAAGTVFFSYVINQLIHAEKYKLLPWIHLNNVSKHVYDPVVHGAGPTVSFEMLHGITAKFVSDGYRRYGFGSYAGPPTPLLESMAMNLTVREYQVTGTGVWNHYFRPVSEFDPARLSLPATTTDEGSDSTTSRTTCRDKPLVRLHYYQLNPGMLAYCPWSVKSWPYNSLRPQLAPKTSLQEWYAPMRQRGHQIATKYIRFQPHIVAQAEGLFVGNSTTNNTTTNKNATTNNENCLAMHIRHSDKGGTNRKKIPVESFLPYAQAYMDAGGTCIVLATDSLDVLDKISKEWPPNLSRAILRQSDHVLRSSNRKAVFAIGEHSHDRTNTEVLVDILAMSKCHFLVHGFSAVSEAVMYLNFDLHKNSVDLEEHPLNHRMTSEKFQELVRKRIIIGKTK
jgi:hypothetical protein